MAVFYWAEKSSVSVDYKLKYAREYTWNGVFESAMTIWTTECNYHRPIDVKISACAGNADVLVSIICVPDKSS